jgi:hypothetical protein
MIYFMWLCLEFAIVFLLGYAICKVILWEILHINQ